MPTALLLISFQHNYFKKKGSPKVKGAKKSAKAAAKLLEYFREGNLPIAHILQTGDLEDLSGEDFQPYELLEPKHEESTLITKEVNAFADQRLNPILQSLEVDHLLILGLTAENQILSTARAAKELGYSCTVAQDGCAATTLKIDGEKLKASLVHKVVMAMMQNSEVEITTTKDFIKADQKKLKKRDKAAAKQVAIEEAAKAALEAASEPDPSSTTQNKARNSKPRNSNTKGKYLKTVKPEKPKNQPDEKSMTAESEAVEK